MVDKPSLSSERRQRPPRRLLLDLNATNVRREDCCQSEDARLLFLEKTRESNRNANLGAELRNLSRYRKTRSSCIILL